MDRYPKLNLPSCRFRVKEQDGETRVWDRLRQCWLVMTPEEWVRRHVIEYFTEGLHIPPASIKQECPVCVNGQNQRADIVVYDRRGEPFLLVECKAPEVAVDADVYAQAVRYNAVLEARYLMLTNGMKHYIYEKGKDETYSGLDTFPVFNG